MCVFLITQLLWLVGRFDHVNWFSHTSWMAVITPSDCPKSVHKKHCVIEVSGGVLLLSFDSLFSDGKVAFVI